MSRFLNVLACISSILVLGLGAARVRGADPIDFNRDIRPILSDRCYTCHGPDAKAREADLRLDVRELAIDSAIEPGKSSGSELISRVTSKDPDERMPPASSNRAPLSTKQIQLLRRWIDEGAAYQAHWSFIPPQKLEVPKVKATKWPRNEVDHFVLARLEAEGLAPSPEADRVTLIRRLYFDLIGLPPSSAEVASFVADKSEHAYERVVDRLLESPHYGERMAIYWLDLVRYADTVGYHGDQGHHISPYRDYVINAFNENIPFDRFTIEQLAGDLLPDATEDQRIATGYNRLLQTSHEGGVQPKEYLAKYLSDRVRNLSQVWMGATMGCSECHDHKFDPYTQRDFYSLGAFFADVKETGDFPGSPNSTPTRRDPELDVLSPIDRQRVEQLSTQMKQLQSRYDALPSDANPSDNDDREALQRQIKQLTDTINQLSKRKHRTMVTIAAAPRKVRILARGDWMDESGEIVEPAAPHFMQQMEIKNRRATRLDLARWLTKPDHPQTSRVFVNRLWYLYFGVGLAKVLDDTGSQGEWPTHPELLDWLAVEFVERGWDVKAVVKLLVTSATYRQSSLETDALRKRDPQNRLFARQARFRLPAEMIRDNALALSGLLVDHVGGRSSRPYQPVGYYANLNFPKRSYKHDADENQYRRGVYTHWQRQFLHPMLKAFDAPSREECTAERPVSNTPSAALALLNDPTFVEAARTFAARILREGGANVEERIHWAWRQATSRSPQPEEVALLSSLYQRHLSHYESNVKAAEQILKVGMATAPDNLKVPELAAWTSVARVLLNLNETITRN